MEFLDIHPENWLSPYASSARLMYFSRAVGIPLTHTAQLHTLPIDEAECAYDDGEVVRACAGDFKWLARHRLMRLWVFWVFNVVVKCFHRVEYFVFRFLPHFCVNSVWSLVSWMHGVRAVVSCDLDCSGALRAGAGAAARLGLKSCKKMMGL